MSESDRTRLIEAEWQKSENRAEDKYTAEIQVYANNRTGLLVDLSRIFTERHIDVRSVTSRTTRQGTATISYEFDVPGKEALSELIGKIRQVESVIDIQRTTG
jgi:GTP pyrophosphokinase